MKKLLFFLISVPLIFSSCEKEENNTSSTSSSSSLSTGYISTQSGEMFKTTNSGDTWDHVYGLNDHLMNTWGISINNFNMMIFL